MCTVGDSCLRSLRASPFSLACLMSHLPQMLQRNGEPGVLLRLRAKQFDLLCFLFCPSLKGKDVPTLLQDCTSLCPGNHETAWETEILSPCPLPPLEKKKMPDRAGFVQEPWWSQAWREFPFSGAVWCLDFEDLYQKWEKQCYQKVGEGSCSVFKQIQKQTNSSWFSGLEGWTTSPLWLPSAQPWTWDIF